MRTHRQYLIPVIVGIVVALAFVAIRRREAMVLSPAGQANAAALLPATPGIAPAVADPHATGTQVKSQGTHLADSTGARLGVGNQPARPPATPAATHEVVIQGLIRIEEPEQKEEFPAGISPFGLREMTGSAEAALHSVLVEATTGEVSQVDEGGAFRMVVRLPVGQEQVALRFTSPFLIYGEHPGDTMPVLIPVGASTVDIEVFMRLGMTFQPMFDGRPITPDDMSNPEVQRAFFEQSAAFIDRYFPHSGNGERGTSDPVELTIPAPGGFPPGRFGGPPKP